MRGGHLPAHRIFCLMTTTPKQILTNLDLIVSGFSLSVTVLVVIVNVGLRYLLHTGLFWAEEVATSAFIWSVFIGSAAAYRYRMHIGIDMVSKFGPPRWRALVAVLIDGLMVAINGYIVYLSILFIQANNLKRTPVLDIPAIYINMALTVGFSLMTVHALRFLYRDLQRLFSPQEASALEGNT